MLWRLHLVWHFYSWILDYFTLILYYFRFKPYLREIKILMPIFISCVLEKFWCYVRTLESRQEFNDLLMNIKSHIESPNYLLRTKIFIRENRELETAIEYAEKLRMLPFSTNNLLKLGGTIFIWLQTGILQLLKFFFWISLSFPYNILIQKKPLSLCYGWS